MDDCSEITIKRLCCTCLSRDRKLFQLCRLTDGVNNLYLLLSYDSEAYREGFYKDTANLFICWECRAVMARISKFRTQACKAQKLLTYIAEGRTDKKSHTDCLSHLSLHHNTTYTKTIISESDTVIDNFIDCGPVKEIKTESDLEDIPLSELHNNFISDNDSNYVPEKTYKKRKKYHENKVTKKQPLLNDNKKYFMTTRMIETEMLDSRERRKIAVVYADSAFKCESCIESYKSQIDLDEHNLDVHCEKEKHKQCAICLVYIKENLIQEHTDSHYDRHTCEFCDYVTYNFGEILRHLESGHAKSIRVPVKRKKGHRKTPKVVKAGSKPRRNQAMMDKMTPYGYSCTECNKHFDNKNKRWKHMQRFHREGYKCATCGKRFAFRNNLKRHEQLHQGPPPREECPTCHKMIRVDLLKIHSRIHSSRDTFSCVECAKFFVSRASYEHHLKYTQAHASVDILKYKCSMCDKGYRSQGELRDHVNYQHMGKTQHKCPICEKALATRRCITRHVRRAHDGVKESARDKICQQCGKAFRDKKGLREHELIHTGERPLSCEICGCTFRQSASLYTHRKRVHNIHPLRRTVQLLDV